MNEVDGYCVVFDTRCDYLGLYNVNPWLDIFIDWQRSKVVFIESEELRHILKEEAFLCGYKGTTSFTVCIMKCSTFLLLRLPINADGVDESNDVLARLASTFVLLCMITVNSNYQTV